MTSLICSVCRGYFAGEPDEILCSNCKKGKF